MIRLIPPTQLVVCCCILSLALERRHCFSTREAISTKKLIFVYICQVRFLAISLRERSAGLFFLQWNRACCLFACLFCPTHSRLHLIFISRRYHAQLSWHSYCVTHETDFATQKLSFYCSLRGYISK